MPSSGKRKGPSGFFSRVVSFFLLLFFAVILISGCITKYVGPERVQGGVRFVLETKKAKRVAIVGSFNQWNNEKDLLSESRENGMWEITIPLSEGRYEYLFLIDGSEWVVDPTVSVVDDGLGGKNSAVSIK